LVLVRLRSLVAGGSRRFAAGFCLLHVVDARTTDRRLPRRMPNRAPIAVEYQRRRRRIVHPKQRPRFGPVWKRATDFREQVAGRCVRAGFRRPRPFGERFAFDRSETTLARRRCTSTTVSIGEGLASKRPGSIRLGRGQNTTVARAVAPPSAKRTVVAKGRRQSGHRKPDFKLASAVGGRRLRWDMRLLIRRPAQGRRVLCRARCRRSLDPLAPTWIPAAPAGSTTSRLNTVYSAERTAAGGPFRALASTWTILARSA